MNRDIIKKEDLDNGDLLYDDEKWKLIQEEVGEADVYKGYADVRRIYQNVETGKFYSIWIKKYYDYSEVDSDLVEVFPKEKTIIIYE